RGRGGILPEAIEESRDAELGQGARLRALAAASAVPEDRLQLVEGRLDAGAPGTARVREHDAERVPRTRGQRRAGGDAPEQGLGLLQRAGALGLEPPEEQRLLLTLRRGGGEVGMGG